MKPRTERKSQIVRRNFPSVCRYEKKGREYFLVDGRSKRWGLNIRKNFTCEGDALGFARELENQISENGKSVNGQVRYQNNHVENLIQKLQTHGKTLDDCVHFYLRHLEEVLKQSVIPSIRGLGEKWFQEKTQNSLEPVTKRTITEYKSFKKYIVHELGTQKPHEVTKV